MSDTISGVRAAQLGNAISDAIHHAVVHGLAMDEAVCIVATVAADYARGEYGPDYLPGLATIVIARAKEPMR
jgi:hypothetical protein